MASAFVITLENRITATLILFATGRECLCRRPRCLWARWVAPAHEPSICWCRRRNVIFLGIPPVLAAAAAPACSGAWPGPCLGWPHWPAPWPGCSTRPPRWCSLKDPCPGPCPLGWCPRSSGNQELTDAPLEVDADNLGAQEHGADFPVPPSTLLRRGTLMSGGAVDSRPRQEDFACVPKRNRCGARMAPCTATT